jgi:hypothetical protein
VSFGFSFVSFVIPRALRGPQRIRGSQKVSRDTIFPGIPHDPRIAGVAVPATPGLRNLFTEVFEDELRPALSGLTEIDDRPKLFLVVRAPLLVVGEIVAQIA